VFWDFVANVNDERYSDVCFVVREISSSDGGGGIRSSGSSSSFGAAVVAPVAADVGGGSAGTVAEAMSPSSHASAETVAVTESPATTEAVAAIAANVKDEREKKAEHGEDGAGVATVAPEGAAEGKEGRVDSKAERESGNVRDVQSGEGTAVFRAHKAILFGSTNYLNSMLRSHMKETGLARIPLAGVSAPVFALLLRYIYGAPADAVRFHLLGVFYRRS
jgi:hypothetical protein